MQGGLPNTKITVKLWLPEELPLSKFRSAAPLL